MKNQAGCHMATSLIHFFSSIIIFLKVGCTLPPM